jgi:hypothetical protein
MSHDHWHGGWQAEGGNILHVGDKVDDIVLAIRAIGAIPAVDGHQHRGARCKVKGHVVVQNSIWVDWNRTSRPSTLDILIRYISSLNPKLRHDGFRQEFSGTGHIGGAAATVKIKRRWL